MDLEERIKEFLRNQHTVLWGRSYTLRDEKDFYQAKEWLLDVIIDLDLKPRKRKNGNL